MGGTMRKPSTVTSRSFWGTVILNGSGASAAWGCATVSASPARVSRQPVARSAEEP